MFAPKPARNRFTQPVLAVFGSLLVHLGLAVVVVTFGRAPAVDLPFEIPMDVTFGVADGMTLREEAPAAAEPPAEPEASPEGPEEAEGAGDGPDAGAPDAGAPDAGPPDAGPDAGEDTEGEDAGEDAEGEDAGEDTEGEDNEPDLVASERSLPPGAHMGLRVDLARVRASSLAGPVRSILNAFPDVVEVLGGTDVSVLDDVDRIYDGSPDGRSEHAVVAGRYRPDQVNLRELVATMATAQNEQPNWRQEHGVEVADWHDPSGVDRVIAVTSPQHFVIAPPETLAAVLAYSQARAERVQAPAAEALLAMEEGSLVTFEIENAGTYISEHPPTTLRAALHQVPAGVEVRGVATYPSEESATAAEAHWSTGLPRLLEQVPSPARPTVSVQREGAELRILLTASSIQVRLGLMAVLTIVEGWQRQPASPRPGSGSSTMSASTASMSPEAPTMEPYEEGSDSESNPPPTTTMAPSPSQ